MGYVIFGIDALSTNPGLSGAGESYLRELVTHLARVDQENEYRIFTGAGRSEWLDIDAPNLRAVAAPGRAGRLPSLFTEQVWLPLAARRTGVHAVLCSGAAVPPFLTVPTVVPLHRLLASQPEFWGGGGGAVYRWRLRLRDRRHRLGTRHAIRRAAAVLASSEQARRDAIRLCGVEPGRVAVAPHGVSDQFRPVDAPQRIARLLEQHGLRAPFFLVAEPLSPYKGLDRVIEGLSQVRKWSHLRPMLALAGSDRFHCWPALERLAGTLGVHEQVRLLGAVPPGDMPVLFSAATASLSLAPGEALGLRMVEAMACGCPVICARRSAAPEIAGDAALFVDPDRPQEVAEAFWRLATLPNIRDAWVERGMAHARQFDWHETARITRDALTAAAFGRPIPRRDTRGQERSEPPAERAPGGGDVRAGA